MRYSCARISLGFNREPIAINDDDAELYQCKNTTKNVRLEGLAEGADAGGQAATGALNHHAAAISTRSSAVREVAALQQRCKKPPNE